MPVRNFTDNSSFVKTSAGSFTTTTDKTYAVLLRCDADPEKFILYSSGEKLSDGIRFTNAGRLDFWCAGSYLNTTIEIPDSKWLLVVIRKSFASGKAMASVYDFETKEWSHKESSGELTINERDITEFTLGALPTAPKANGANARIAAIFAKKAVLTVEQVESLASATALTDWLELSPDALWFFNQAEVSEEVKDLTENGADQTKEQNSEVIEEEPPIPYEAEGGEGEPTRRFDGEDDKVRCAIGKASAPLGGISIAALVKVTSDPGKAAILSTSNNDGFTNGYVLRINESGKLEIEGGNSTAESSTAFPFDENWKLVIAQAGTAVNRFAVYDFTEEEWVIEENGLGSLGSAGAGKAVSVGENGEGSDFCAMDIAAAGIWGGRLNLEERNELVGSETLNKWLEVKDLSENPALALLLFDQDEVSEDVKDVTGNGADQEEITGTEVISQEIPTPYGEEIEFEFGVYVKVKIGGELVAAKRWIKLPSGELVSA